MRCKWRHQNLDVAGGSWERKCPHQALSTSAMGLERALEGSWTALHTVHIGKLSPRKRKGFSQAGHKALQVIIPFLVEVGKL